MIIIKEEEEEEEEKGQFKYLLVFAEMPKNDGTYM